MKGQKSRPLAVVEEQHGERLRKLSDLLHQIDSENYHVQELRQEREKLIAELYDEGATRMEVAQWLGVPYTVPWLTVR
jgi:uncharacterized protein YlxW (UPF0749 family)